MRSCSRSWQWIVDAGNCNQGVAHKLRRILSPCTYVSPESNIIPNSTSLTRRLYNDDIIHLWSHYFWYRNAQQMPQQRYSKRRRMASTGTAPRSNWGYLLALSVGMCSCRTKGFSRPVAITGVIYSQNRETVLNDGLIRGQLSTKDDQPDNCCSSPPYMVTIINQIIVSAGSIEGPYNCYLVHLALQNWILCKWTVLSSRQRWSLYLSKPFYMVCTVPLLSSRWPTVCISGVFLLMFLLSSSIIWWEQRNCGTPITRQAVNAKLFVISAAMFFLATIVWYQLLFTLQWDSLSDEN